MYRSSRLTISFAIRLLIVKCIPAVCLRATIREVRSEAGDVDESSGAGDQSNNLGKEDGQEEAYKLPPKSFHVPELQLKSIQPSLSN